MMNYETLKADAEGEMILLRRIARIWLATCNDEEVNYNDREALRSFDRVATSELLDLVEALVQNIIETA